MELRVGIEYVCNNFQCLFSWWMLDNNDNNNQWDLKENDIIQKPKLEKMNNKYLDEY